MYTVTVGGTGDARDLNQLVNALQRPIGQVEVGNYYIQASAYAVGARVSSYIRTTSQGSTPASVAFDNSINNGFIMNNPTTDTLNQYGFHITATSSNTGTDASTAGNWYVQY